MGAVPAPRRRGSQDAGRGTGRRLAWIAAAALGSGAILFLAYLAVSRVVREAVDERFAPRRVVRLENGRPDRAPGLAGRGRRMLPLRVAVAPVVCPETSLVRYEGFTAYLGRALGREAVMLRRGTYAEVNELLRTGLCDMALVCTYALVRGEREFGMEVLAAPRIRGEITYRSYIIVPASSHAASLPDLRGRRFASADLMSNSGWLYPAVWLKERGEDPERFFSQHLVTGGHDRSVQAVVSGLADGAAVDSLVYDAMAEADPTILARTRVILTSPPFGMPPIAVHPRIDPSLRRELLRTLLGMHEDPEGARLLAELGIDRFEVPGRALYDDVRRAAAFWESR